ncbi:tetratricopeptide repeat protein [Kordia zhangzhouensis]|uniref:tetratricopeptide repeat protein n=1 Tax=Kordia zhangzhouensis TaxID=1620405 RepID=UPI00062985FD|nr:tetratricopeptide repeat protein [Kordia zhangzhouensis]
MKKIIFIVLLGFFSWITAQTPQMLLDSALLKKEQLKFDEGIKLCQKAIQLDSTLATAYFYKAGFHAALIKKQNARQDFQHYQAAIANYSKVITLNSTQAEAYFYRGGVHETMGFLNKALEDYSKSISVNENQPKVYNSIGVCYAKKGKLNLALYYFEKAILYDGKYAKAYFNKGNIHDMQQNPINACENWKKAIELGYVEHLRNYREKCKEK